MENRMTGMYLSLAVYVCVVYSGTVCVVYSGLLCVVYPSTFGALGERHSPTKTELRHSNAILPCKTTFLSHKHNNDRNDEQTLIQEQITEKMSRLCWTTLRPRPLFKCLWTHTHISPTA